MLSVSASIITVLATNAVKNDVAAIVFLAGIGVVLCVWAALWWRAGPNINVQGKRDEGSTGLHADAPNRNEGMLPHVGAASPVHAPSPTVRQQMPMHTQQQLKFPVALPLDAVPRMKLMVPIPHGWPDAGRSVEFFAPSMCVPGSIVLVPYSPTFQSGCVGQATLGGR